MRGLFLPIGGILSGGAPSITAPTDIANLALWLDGSDESTLYISNSEVVTADDQALYKWTDKSGNGNDVFQAGASANRPHNRRSIQNGLGVVRADQSLNPQWFANPASVLTQTDAVTIFYVAATAVNETIGAVYCDTNIGNLRIAAFIDSRDAFRRGVIFADSAGSANPAIPADIGTEFNVISGTIDAGTVTNYLNGAAGSSLNLGGDGVVVSDYTRVFNQGAGATALTGDIAELIVYDALLNSEQRTAVEAWLKSKWATP